MECCICTYVCIINSQYTYLYMELLQEKKYRGVYVCMYVFIPVSTCM